MKLFRGGEGCLLGMTTITALLLAIALSCAFCGCTTTRYVPVEKEHTEHHWHTDTVIEKDSVVKESLTTVMQLDSAEMAKYGIQLKKAERAWLVKTAELERQIERLMAKSDIKDTVRDSIPVPYPVEVVKEPTIKDRLWQYGISTLIAALVLLLFRLWIKRIFP